MKKKEWLLKILGPKSHVVAHMQHPDSLGSVIFAAETGILTINELCLFIRDIIDDLKLFHNDRIKFLCGKCDELLAMYKSENGEKKNKSAVILKTIREVDKQRLIIMDELDG